MLDARIAGFLSFPRPLVAAGGYDGKVKLFNAQSGLCFVTFAEHTAAVQDLCFTPQGLDPGSAAIISEDAI